MKFISIKTLGNRKYINPNHIVYMEEDTFDYTGVYLYLSNGTHIYTNKNLDDILKLLED